MPLSSLGLVEDPPGTDPDPRPRDPDEDFLAGWIPYEEHVRELAVLKLVGQPYTPDEYAAAMAVHLKMRIRIREAPEARPGSSPATIQYDPRTNTLTIWVARRLTWWLRQYAIFHELAHAAAGHPFKDRCTKTGRVLGELPAPKRIARKAPLTEADLPKNLPDPYRRDLDKLREDEADLRAQHNMITGPLGGRSLELDRLNQLR